MHNQAGDGINQHPTPAGLPCLYLYQSRVAPLAFSLIGSVWATIHLCYERPLTSLPFLHSTQTGPGGCLRHIVLKKSAQRAGSDYCPHTSRISFHWIGLYWYNFSIMMAWPD